MKTTIRKLISTLCLLTTLAAQTATGFYDPNLQRWLTPDPLGESGGINLYQFVGNDPANRVDPFGLSDFDLDNPPRASDVMLGPNGYYLDNEITDPGILEAYTKAYMFFVANTLSLIPGEGQVLKGLTIAGRRLFLTGERCVAKGIPSRQSLMLSKNVGYNISPESWFTKYSALGKQGTFLTDYRAIGEVLGPIRANQAFKVGWFSGQGQVSYWKAWKLERSLGLERGSLKNGFRFTRVSDINALGPRSPLMGNKFFQGPGKGLPGRGPEIVVDPIPTP